MRDKNGTPYSDPYYFGLYTCAYCLDPHEIHRSERCKYTLLAPQFGDQAKTEVIIPAGKQAFHISCLKKLREEGA